MEVEAERVVEVAILCPGLYTMHLQRAGETNPIDFWNKLQRHVHLCLSTKKACKSLTYKLLCDPGRVRTSNHQSRNLIFYPVELRGQFGREIRVKKSNAANFSCQNSNRLLHRFK
jgi:hypothetical protein